MPRFHTGHLALLLTAALFGIAFIFQRHSATAVSALTFMSWRLPLSALMLLAVLALRRRPVWGHWLRDGICCGILLFLGMYSQQWGLEHTTAGKSGFITSLYVILVPLLALLGGERLGRTLILATLLAFAGLTCFAAIHSDSAALNWNAGDSATLASAIIWALYVNYYGIAVRRSDLLALTTVQMAAAALITLVAWWAALVALEPLFSPGPWRGRTLALVAVIMLTPALVRAVRPSRDLIAMVAAFLAGGAGLALLLNDLGALDGWLKDPSAQSHAIGEVLVSSVPPVDVGAVLGGGVLIAAALLSLACVLMSDGGADVVGATALVPGIALLAPTLILGRAPRAHLVLTVGLCALLLVVDGIVQLVYGLVGGQVLTVDALRDSVLLWSWALVSILLTVLGCVLVLMKARPLGTTVMPRHQGDKGRDDKGR